MPQHSSPRPDRIGRNRPEWRQVYFIEAEGLGLVKIGCADDARHRLSTLQTGSPVRLTLHGVYHTDDAPQLEELYHKRYAPLRVHGEWFRIDDNLRELMDDAFDPEDDRCRFGFRPRDPTPGSVSIHSHPDDTPESLSDRVFAVMQALGAA